MDERFTLSFTQNAGTDAGGDEYQFVPCFAVRASTGEQVTTVWTSLTRTAATMIQSRLPDGVDPGQALREALLRFSLRRLQRELADPVGRDALLGTLTNTWQLDSDDVDQFLAVAVGDKTCGRRVGCAPRRVADAGRDGRLNASWESMPHGWVPPSESAAGRGRTGC